MSDENHRNLKIVNFRHFQALIKKNKVRSEYKRGRAQKQTITLKMGDQEWLEFYVVFTMILCAINNKKRQ